MAGTSAQRCANPACIRPVRQPATGRPARYCSPACRQAAHRDRARQAAEAAQRAARLAAAKETCAATWRPLEETCADAADTARAVLCYAAGEDRAGLVAKLTELHHAVARMEELALAYHDAAAEAACLTQPAP